MTPSSQRKYQEDWRAYRRARNTFAFVFLTYIPAGGIGASLGFWLFGSPLLGFVVVLTWMGAFLVTSIRLQCWPCPRCGERFSAKGWYNKGFLARKCVHCGLAKYALDDLEGNR
jgi:hypothetical protein